METPLRLYGSAPMLLCHVALMTIASDPDVRGDDKTAYAFTPETDCFTLGG